MTSRAAGCVCAACVGDRASLSLTAERSPHAMSSPTGPSAVESTGAIGTAPAAGVAGVKRVRVATTFVLPCGELFELSEAGSAAFPDGLLHRLAVSELTARDESGAIPFNFPCDRDAFALAIAEHEHHGKHAQMRSGKCTGPAMTTPVNPQTLAVLWDYLQLDHDLIDPDLMFRRRPGTPITVQAGQMLLRRSISLAQQLRLFLNALGSSDLDKLSPSIRLPCVKGGTDCTPGSVRLALWLGSCPSIDEHPDGIEWERSEQRASDVVPDHCRSFSRELFDLLLEPKRLTAITRFLPGCENELKVLSMTSCTDEDHLQLQRLADTSRIAIPALVPRTRELYDAHCFTERLLGGFALAVPLVHVFCESSDEPAHLEFVFPDITVHLKIDFVGIGDSFEWIDGELTSPRAPGAEKYIDSRQVIISARCYLNRYRFESELPAVSIAMETCCHDDEDGSLAWRNAFFGSERKVIRGSSLRRNYHYYPHTADASRSKVFSSEEYEEVVNTRLGKDTMYAADALCFEHVAVCPQGMSTPTVLWDATLYSENFDMQEVALAYDVSDHLGADNCKAYAFFQFEVHALQTGSAPPLACQCGGQGSYPVQVAGHEGKFAWLDVTADEPSCV